MKNKYKIVVVGLGYVGLSNAVLLAQKNTVIGVDTCDDRVSMVNARKSPIADDELIQYFNHKQLDLSATTNLSFAVKDADYVIVATPTNYDEEADYFDVSSVDQIIEQVIMDEPHATIVIRSTIPVGYVDSIKKRLDTESVFFVPEFLREGSALYDNLYPSRIIVGEKSPKAEMFAYLLSDSAMKKDTNILFTGSQEAEAIKLFSNTYLAMRVTFFNELDSYALHNNLSSRDIIDAVCLDPRIGNSYNNPSFGYGGYCLPKDTKQLLANFQSIPQNLIKATVDSNVTRKNTIANAILEYSPEVVGVYRLAMKAGSDNFRDSAVCDIIRQLIGANTQVIIYEPAHAGTEFLNCHVEPDLNIFKSKVDIIIANRVDRGISDVMQKVFTRDLYHNG